VSLELRAAREDGTDSWLKLIASIIRDGTGTPQQLLIQYEDITERRQAQEQLSEYSFVDALTQLPNRLLALDRIRQSLARAARTGRSVAGRSAAASARPSWEFSSSTIPYAAMRGSSFEAREPSPRLVCPWSPPRV
jgi:hypothetical protein